MSDITLEWFFKIPGLFITGGFLLILIALLVFFLGGKKEKNKEDNLAIDSDNNDALVFNNENISEADENNAEINKEGKLEEAILFPQIDGSEETVSSVSEESSVASETENEPIITPITNDNVNDVMTYNNPIVPEVNQNEVVFSNDSSYETQDNTEYSEYKTMNTDVNDVPVENKEAGSLQDENIPTYPTIEPVSIEPVKVEPDIPPVNEVGTSEVKVLEPNVSQEEEVIEEI